MITKLGTDTVNEWETNGQMFSVSLRERIKRGGQPAAVWGRHWYYFGPTDSLAWGNTNVFFMRFPPDEIAFFLAVVVAKWDRQLIVAGMLM